MRTTLERPKSFRRCGQSEKVALTLTIANRQTLVSKGRITLPLTGCWHADLWADMQTVPSGQVVATLSGVDMPAHIQRAEIVQGLLQMRLVGGRGGMAKNATPRHYAQPLVRHILGDLLADAGEALSTTSTASVLGTGLSYWTSLAVPTGSLLQALTEIVGESVNWRVLFDGTVWIGERDLAYLPGGCSDLQAGCTQRRTVPRDGRGGHLARYDDSGAAD